MSSRTEPPTPKRLAEARRRGEVPSSRDLTSVAALLGGLAGLAASGPWLAGELASLVRGALRAAPAAELAPREALEGSALAVARLSLAPALAATTAAALAGALQSGFLFAPASAAPRLERLDPARGLARLCSLERLATLLLGLLKAALAGGLAVSWASGQAGALLALPSALDPWSAGASLLRPLVLRLVALLLLFGLADLVLSRWRHRRGLLMTREEVRREAREEEGDPRHKSERRHLHRALAEAGPVASASCVVVNPTHVAVALRHVRGSGEAPRVLAKGTGRAAARIRSAARLSGVPIVRDPPLARALHRLAEVGDEIPEELHDAAALVLAHLHGFTGEAP